MAESTTGPAHSVHIAVRQSTGVITLDRPKALNSINPEILFPVIEALEEWRDDEGVERVVVKSSGKHFCAGGDVRYAREAALGGRAQEADEFFSREYAMNLMIAEYPKPYISLISGVVMGGGLGLSAHGSHVVVTPDVMASMPEMNIGFFTDVGMSHRLQNLPKRPSLDLGMFLALTGYRMNAGDMIATGLATHLVDSLDGLAERIIEEGPGVLDEVASQPGVSELEKLYPLIDGAFSAPWSEIKKNIAADPELAAVVEPLLQQASPSSLVATAELMLANSTNDLATSLDNERRYAEMLVREPDFHEGVRAVLVDKTNDAAFEPEPGPEKYRDVLE
ncbi:3-hydroxyisobutyryl-CoA hydrolase [Corynebacterium sp. 20_84]